MMKKLILLLTTLAISSSVGLAQTTPNPATVDLGDAKGFAILSKTGITNVYQSTISLGDVGTSPITGAAIHLTIGEVDWAMYTVDAAGPAGSTPDATRLTAAVGAMETAYVDAAGRSTTIPAELGAGEIGGLELAPGVYKWSSDLLISTDVTLSGGEDDVWIFQVAGTLNLANGKEVTLKGGALEKNIFWQVAGAVTLGTNANFKGIVLGKTMIAVNTGAVVNGRLLAQTAVTLQKNSIIAP
jgi:hypothetical protein